METMRAIVFDRFGGPKELREAHLPRPEVRRGEVLVSVDAVSVNGADLLLRSGKLGLFAGRHFPKQLGIDFVGSIIAAHETVDLDKLAVGDHIWGTVDGGMRSLAEVVSVSATQIARAPRGLTAEEAATLLAGGTTAYIGLIDKAGLREGDHVLVRGASGGVGSIAVQLAKSRGAHVTALASATSTEFLHGLGADIVHDYRTTALTDIGTFDVIFDTHGRGLLEVRRLLARGGRMVAISFDEDAPVRSLLDIASTSIFGSRRIRAFSGKPSRPDFERLTTQVERGELRPVLHKAFPFVEAAKAHEALEAGGIHGKVVISITE